MLVDIFDDHSHRFFSLANFSRNLSSIFFGCLIVSCISLRIHQHIGLLLKPTRASVNTMYTRPRKTKELHKVGKDGETYHYNFL